MRIKRVVTGALLVLLGMGGLDRGFAQSGPPMPPLPPGQLLDVWEFSGSNFFSLRKDAPISLTNVALVPTWAGNGLQVDSTNAAWINYAVVEPNGQKNLDVAQGTVTMWLSFDFDSSDGLGAWGVILEAGNWDTNLASATGAWGIFISPDGSNLYFSAQTNGVLTNYCNTPIAWYAGDWHHLAVTFDSTNSAIYLDGAIADSGPGVTIIPGSEVLSNGFSIGSDGNDTGMLQARSVFNDVAIYDYPLDATTISNDYFYESQYVYPLPGGGGFGMDDGPSLPGGYDGGGGTNSSDGSTNGPGYSVPTNGFYLELLTFGTNAYNTNASAATILVHSTENDATNEPIYQLWSATNLNPPVAWTVEQTFLGTTNTNFTALIVSMTNRPTLFFEAVNLGSDPTDSSLPVWYLLQNGLDPTSLYTGTNLVSNAYLDPMGDGWTYQALFSSGMSPGVLYAPPAPSGFTAKLMTNGLVLLSWNPAANLPASGAGAVTGYRSQLTWNNRLANTQNAQVYNFYSSGEEVLRNWTNGAAPAGLFGVAAQQVYGYVEHGGPFGSFTWALQELEKGRMGENIILSSGHNGWGFNTYYSSFLGTLMSPSNAAALTTDELQTNAFFDTSFFNGMFGPSGSTYAQQNTNFIIATAIPVVSQCTGANPVTFLDQPSNPHNFDMSTNTFENGWPITRQQNLSEPNNWYHSDMRVVAYTYTQGLFDKMVTLGNLQ